MNRDLWPNQQYSISERKEKAKNPDYEMKKLEDKDPAIPCGLTAKSFFNDEYKLQKIDDEGTVEDITINEENIAWDVD